MLLFADCNCAVGLPDAIEGWRLYEPADIQRTLTQCGIQTAFAFHNAALSIHPIEGNTEILTLCNQNSFFKPVFSVLPNHTGEFFDADVLCTLLKKNNVKMVRLCPQYNMHSFSLRSWCSRTLLAALEKEGVVVLLHAAEADWDTVNEVCENHPKLKLVITNLYYRHARYVLALLLRHKHLYLETSGLKSFGLLQTVAERAGAHKLLFGTNSGVFSAGSAVCLVSYALLPMLQKQKIALYNLEALLERALL